MARGHELVSPRLCYRPDTIQGLLQSHPFRNRKVHCSNPPNRKTDGILNIRQVSADRTPSSAHSKVVCRSFPDYHNRFARNTVFRPWFFSHRSHNRYAYGRWIQSCRIIQWRLTKELRVATCEFLPGTRRQTLPDLRRPHAGPGKLALPVLWCQSDPPAAAGGNPGFPWRGQPTQAFRDIRSGLDRRGGRHVRCGMGPVFRARAILGAEVTRLCRVADGFAPTASSRREDQ